MIPLGPKAQAIVKEFLKPNLDAHLFSPRDHVLELRAARAASRKTKPTPSELRRRRRAKPATRMQDRYDRRTYQQTVVCGCNRAFPHPTLARIPRAALTPEQREKLKAWRKAHGGCVLQLRHTAATEFRAKYGLEAAQVVLGHAKADVTQVYAERDLAKAREVMREIG